jgi:hypothetical protein
MIMPNAYRQFRDEVPFDEINFGFSGIELFPLEAIESEQVGYSIDPTGKSLCTGEPGSWESAWIVIGRDSCLGDPIILDSASPGYTVLTSAHGEGEWDLSPISVSLSAFQVSLQVVAQIASGRESPMALENNPLPDELRDAALSSISAVNPGIDLYFWELFLENE